jgi:hypothetical protein
MVHEQYGVGRFRCRRERDRALLRLVKSCVGLQDIVVHLRKIHHVSIYFDTNVVNEGK